QLRERTMERKGRDVWVWVPDQKPCVDGTAASKNQSTGQPFWIFAAGGSMATVDAVPHKNVPHALNCSSNSLQLEALTCKYLYRINLQWRRKRDSNPRTSFPVNGFQDRRLKPLGHSSI